MEITVMPRGPRGESTQRGHIRSCKRFTAFLKRSPDTATREDIRRFQLHLADAGVSICTRNCIMTGLRFLFRVTLRRLDLAAEIYHTREPQKIPLVMSADETKRLLAVASTFVVSGWLLFMHRSIFIGSQINSHVEIIKRLV
jgi:site-specific recombinase XerD